MRHIHERTCLHNCKCNKHLYLTLKNEKAKEFFMHETLKQNKIFANKKKKKKNKRNYATSQ